MTPELHHPERPIPAKSRARNISFGDGHVCTVALEQMRHADGSRIVTVEWAYPPGAPKRLTIDQAEALNAAIAAAKRELLRS